MDVAQEVFIKLLKSLAQFDKSIGKFRTWLKKILLNALRDEKRREARRKHVNMGQVDFEPATVEDVDRRWEEEHQMRLYQRAVQVIREGASAKHWNCFWEHLINSRPAKEVAEELGMGVSAVYVNAHRIRNKIKEKCADYEIE